ncbi:uncharacterized protein LOC142317606 [Lycorma delicatula]|uniref:uncharacterized protein LOC142317606 n=1 Tax=Lycorma delicatula TaxID=130591 RepID=UPI003F511156
MLAVEENVKLSKEISIWQEQIKKHVQHQETLMAELADVKQSHKLHSISHNSSRSGNIKKTEELETIIANHEVLFINFNTQMLSNKKIIEELYEKDSLSIKKIQELEKVIIDEETQFMNLNTQILSNEEIISELNQRISSLIQSSDKLKSELSSCFKEREELENTINSNKIQLNNFNEQVLRNAITNEELNKKISSLIQNSEKLNLELSSSIKKREELENIIANNNVKLSNLKKEVLSNQKNLSEIKEQNSLLTECLDTVRSELFVVVKKSYEQEDISEKENKLNNLLDQISSNENLIKEHQGSVKRHEDAFQEDLEKCSKTKALLELVREEHMKLIEDVQSLKNDKDKLQLIYNEAVENWENLKVELADNKKIEMDLENQLILSNQEMVLSLKKKDVLQQQLSSECEVLKKKLELFDALKKDLLNVEKNYQHEKTKAENLSAEVHKLENLRSSDQDVISDISEKYSLLKKNLETVKFECSNSNKKSEKLEKQVADYKNEMANLNTHILSNEKRIKELAEIDKEYNILLKSHKRCGEIKAELESLDEMYAKLLVENESLRNENGTLKEDKHRQHTEFDEAAKNWTNLEKELTNKNNEIKVEFEKQLGVLKLEMVSSLEMKDGLLQSLFSECEFQKKQLKLFEANLESVQQNYQQEKTLVESLRTEIHELKNIQTSNQNVISELHEKNSHLIQNIEAFKSELCDSNKKVKELEKKVVNYKNQLTNLNEIIQSKEKRIEELIVIDEEYIDLLESHKKCDKVKVKLESLNEIHTQLLVHNEFLRNENDALKEDQHRLHVESDKAVKNWENLEKELKNKNYEIKIDFENKLAVLKQDMISSLEKKDALLQDLSSECELLRKQLEISETLQADLESAQQSYQHEKTVAESLKAEIHELENLHSSNLNVISKLGERNSTLTQNIEAFKTELSDSSNEIEKLEKSIADYETEFTNLNANLRYENSAVKQDLHKLCVDSDEAAKNWADLEIKFKKDNIENKIDFEKRLAALNQEMLEKTVSENLKAEVQELKNLKASNECVISELADRNSLLTENIETLKSELSISNKKSAKLGEEITNYKTDLSRLNSQIFSDVKTIQELRLTEKEYNVFLESHKDCEEIKAKLEFLNEMHAKLELDNKCYRSIFLHMKDVEKEVIEKRYMYKFITSPRKTLVSSLEKKDTLLQDLTSKCELLRKQLEISEALKADLENVQQNYQHEKTIAENLREEIQKLEHLHSSNLTVISELCERNSMLTQNLEALKSELSVSDNKIEKLEEVIAGYKTELISLNAKLLSNEKRIEELIVIEEEYNVLLESHKNCDEIKVKLISLNETHVQLLLDNESVRYENSVVKQDLHTLHVDFEEAAKNWANLEKGLIKDNNENKIDFEKKLAGLNQEMVSLDFQQYWK